MTRYPTPADTAPQEGFADLEQILRQGALRLEVHAYIERHKDLRDETDDFADVLHAILGERAAGPSPTPELTERGPGARGEKKVSRPQTTKSNDIF